MNPDTLIESFQRGTLTRRQLIARLMALGAAGAGLPRSPRLPRLARAQEPASR